MTLFRRMLAVLCGVAAASTALALLLQERTLSADLRRAAHARLERAAEAARELADLHLRGLAQRYAAVSGTPQFRAHLELNDQPTLAHYAEALLEQQGASGVAFLDGAGRVVAAAGEQTPAPETAEEGFVAVGGRPYAAALVPLETAGQRVGALLAVEPLRQELIAQWSRLCGARVAFRPDEQDERDGLSRSVRRAGDLFLRVELNLDAERAAIARARRNLLLAGGVALAAALLAGIAFSRGLTAPILDIKRAAERVGAGDLTVRLESSRRDEIGDVARAFEAMAASLRATLASAHQAADGVEEAAARIATVTDDAARATRDQERDRDQAAESMERIDAQVSALSRTAAELSSALSKSIAGSSASFLELDTTGDTLVRSAAHMASRTDDISGSIAQMVGSARAAAEGAERLLDAADTTVASMHEMEGSTRNVHENAVVTSELAQQALGSAELGAEGVQGTVEGMEAIREAAELAQRAMGELGTRVDRIGSILAVIDEVADETGLLALNAAIIAARSGESGRAFGVVASEMKALAGRVGRGTKEIEELVGSIQRHCSGATAAIERNAERVREGASLARETRGALAQITEAARASQDHMRDVVRAADVQTRTAGEVCERMERVREGVRSIRASGTEQERANEVVLSGSAALRDVAREVQASIEAQTEVAARIGEGIEGVRKTVERIQGALGEQASACREALELLRSSRAHTGTQERSTRATEEAARDLLREAEALRERIRGFVI